MFFLNKLVDNWRLWRRSEEDLERLGGASVRLWEALEGVCPGSGKESVRTHGHDRLCQLESHRPMTALYILSLLQYSVTVLAWLVLWLGLGPWGLAFDCRCVGLAWALSLRLALGLDLCWGWPYGKGLEGFGKGFGRDLGRFVKGFGRDLAGILEA